MCQISSNCWKLAYWNLKSIRSLIKYFVSSLQGQDGVRIKENKDNDKGKTNKVKNNKNEDVQEPSGKESSKQVKFLYIFQNKSSTFNFIL